MKISERIETPEYRAIMDEQIGLWQSIAPKLREEEIERRLSERYSRMESSGTSNVYKTEKIRFWLLGIYGQRKGRIVSIKTTDFYKAFKKWYPFGHCDAKKISNEVKHQVRSAMNFLGINGRVVKEGDKVYFELGVRKPVDKASVEKQIERLKGISDNGGLSNTQMREYDRLMKELDG